jgi:Glycosyltransferase family 87
MKVPRIIGVLPKRFWMLTDATAVAALVFIAFYYLTGFHFERLITERLIQGDFNLQYDFPWETFIYARYPSAQPFPYPPSAIMMLLPLHLLPKTAAFLVWIVAQAASLWIVVWGALKLSGASNWPGKWALSCAGVLLTEYPLSWDFRSHNNNFMILALIMLGVTTRRTWLSAMLLAASSGLKVYSSLLLLVFAWRREWRLTALTAFFLVVICIILPMIVFGPTVFLQLVHGWLDQVRFTASPQGYDFGNHITTLRLAFATLLTADPWSRVVIILLRASQIFWALLVVGYFAIASRPYLSPGNDISRLADVCIAILAPLPLSTWLEPHHAVVMLPAFILLLTTLFRDEWPLTVRALSATALSGPIITQIVMNKLATRGLAFLMCFSLILVGLTAVRWASIRFANTDVASM